MLYLVRMDVHLPHDMLGAQAEEIKAREKAYSQDLQRQGKWQQLHRVVGEYANYSVFDVESHDELHTLLVGTAALSLYDHAGHFARASSFCYSLTYRLFMSVHGREKGSG